MVFSIYGGMGRECQFFLLNTEWNPSGKTCHLQVYNDIVDYIKAMLRVVKELLIALTRLPFPKP